MLYEQLKVLLQQSPVVPIIIPGVSFHTTEEAINVAKALKQGGVLILEILMRGDLELQNLVADSIRAIRAESELSDITICAGTINSFEKMKLAVEAGADFMVSADGQAQVVAHWQEHYAEQTLFAPAASTPTEVANLLAVTSLVKLFPTNQFSQRDRYLSSLTAIYGQKGTLLLSYDVTEPANIIDLQYLMVSGIAAAWMTPMALIRDQQWDKITQLAQLSITAAEQARAKQFTALQESTAMLYDLSGLEPAKKEQSTQTGDLSPSRYEGGSIFGLGTISDVIQSVQDRMQCRIM